MLIIGILIVVLVIISLIYGYSDVVNIQVIIEVNDLSTPYHHLGVSFFGEYENEQLVEQLIIGMIFFNVVIVFYKQKE
jgi:hypothetical protein